MESVSRSSEVSPSCCPGCGSECASQRITFTLHRSPADFVMFHNVPAEVCPVCGESLFSLQTSSWLLAILRSGCEPDEMATVPVYDFRRFAC